MMKIKYLIEGRIIPERTVITLPNIFCKTALREADLEINISSVLSKLFIFVESNIDINPHELRNFLYEIVGPVIDRVSFIKHFGLSFELDSFSDISNNITLVYGVDGYAFQSDLLNGLTFRPNDQHQKFELPILHLENTALARATFELKNAIRNPSYTAFHCRLAIEAIRNHFASEDNDKDWKKIEFEAWKKLRELLRINRNTIESFKDAADNQRHGRNVPQTWEQRRDAMQIAWEICHRFIIWLNNPEGLPLEESHFPQF